jgi:ATP-binding cassette subfamily B protein
MKRRKSFSESLPGLSRVLRQFAPYVREQRALVIGSLLALIVEVALRTLEPWPLKFIIDHLLSTNTRSRFSFLRIPETTSPTTIITLAAVAIIVITGLRALADYANTIGFALVGNRVLTRVRGEIYRHLQRLSLAYHTKARSGDLVLRVMSDVNIMKDVVVTAALPLLASILILFGMLAVMFVLNWKLTLLSLATLPLFWVSTLGLTRRIQHAARNQRHRESVMAANAAETIGAIKIVQALGLEKLFSERFLRRNQESLKEDVRGARLTAGLARSVGFLLAVSTAIVLWYGARLVLAGELSPGELLVFLTYLRNTYRPVQDLAKYTGRLAKATAAGERVLDILDQTPAVCDLPGALEAPPFHGAIAFEDVDFAYERRHWVLDKANFEVPAGHKVALVGPSGIGKSTIVSLLLRLYDPKRGQIKIDGRDIREYTLASLRAQMSIVFQDTVLFAASVRENIGYGTPNASQEEIEEAARLANADEFIRNLPEGYETILGERGVDLSGGQRQRLAIARAALRKAPILILDEPTTGLDEENESSVLEALERVANGRTTFIIAHDLRLTLGADLILYLEDGRVIENGTHTELMDANGRYATLYRRQLLDNTNDQGMSWQSHNHKLASLQRVSPPDNPSVAPPSKGGTSECASNLERFGDDCEDALADKIG